MGRKAKIMSWIVENWSYIVLLGAVILVGYTAVAKFLALPRKDQEEKIAAFLLHAVTMAEKEFGSGTGRLKLSFVYNAFLEKFGWLALICPYEKFAALVEEVLKEARVLWEQNANIKQIVQGDTNE